MKADDITRCAKRSLLTGMLPLAAVLFIAGQAPAAQVTSCSDCHRMPPLDAAYRNITTGAVRGNHQTHQPAVATPAHCAPCHPGSAAYTLDHRNGVIQLSANINSSPVAATYSKGVFFNQTSLPLLGTCANVNCHFEKVTTAWGSAPLVSPAGCTACHGNPPADGSHPVTGQKHANYYGTTTSSCGKCHPDHTASARPFAHATSAGKRGLILQFTASPNSGGSYSKTANLAYPAYLPSRTTAANRNGTCAGLYCHSDGNGGVPAVTPTWGGTLPADCTGCHGGNATAVRVIATGLHGQHVNNAAVLGTNYGCAACHSTSVGAGNDRAITGTATHVAGSKTVSFSGGGSYSATAKSCTSTICHAAGKSTAPQPTAPVWTGAAMGCNGCHGRSNASGTPDYTNGGAAAALANSHAKHVAAAADCNNCHTNTTTTGTAIKAGSALHTNGAIDVTFNATKAGVTAAWTAGTKSCTNVYCHGTTLTGGTAKSPVWGATLTGCATCHGYPPATASGVHTGATATQCINCHPHVNATGTGFTDPTKHINNAIDAAGGHAVPFYAHSTPPFTTCTGCHNASAAGVYPAATGVAPNCRGCHVAADPTVTATGCTSCHGSPPTGTTRPNVAGSHAKHSALVGTPNNCAICHNGAGAGSGAAHGPGNRGGNPAVDNVIFTAAQAGASATWTASTKTCSSTYCHGATLTGGTTKNPVWGTTLTGCATCHGNPPATATHTGVTSTQCIDCHSHVNATGTGFTNAALHINGTVEGGDCVTCHGTAQPITAAGAGALVGGTRRAVSLEFAGAWSHKRSAAGTVTKYDCIVCHMEGDMATGSTTAAHKNGLIELRDPDTGLTIKGVTWGGTGAGAYTSTTADMTFNRFSRNLASATIEPAAAATQINLCLKCHDADGALSASARVPGGTAQKPFATTIAGAAYTGAGVTAGGVLGGVTDIKASFAPTNSTYHPVMGKQNNSYTQGTRMVAPWTLAKTTGNNTQWGNLITCWDCHAASGATGVQTSTVTAHGGAVTLRQPAFGTNPTTGNTGGLCIACHAGYNLSTLGNAHGTGSAFNSSVDSGMNTYMRTQCHACHSSWSTADGGLPVRPFRAQDAHGFDALRKTSATDKMWPVGTTETFKPYGFIRAGFTTQHKPLSGPGVPTGSATCSGYGGACSRSSMGSYTPGGVY